MKKTTTIADVEAIAESDKSILCVIYDDEFWIPKKCLGRRSQVNKLGDFGYLEVHLWFAEKEGLD